MSPDLIRDSLTCEATLGYVLRGKLHCESL